MKNILLTSLLLLGSSISYASKKNESNDVYLIKTQGADSFDSPNSIYLSCKLGPKQLNSVKGVQDKILKAHTEKEVTGMHIMAQVPSIEYKVLFKDKELILKKDSSSLVYRDGKASRELMAIMDKMCQWK